MAEWVAFTCWGEAYTVDSPCVICQGANMVYCRAVYTVLYNLQFIMPSHRRRYRIKCVTFIS